MMAMLYVNGFNGSFRGRLMNIGVAEIRDNFADALNRVMYQGERIVLERRGKGVAVLVSMDDLALLEHYEDQFDIAEAKKALAEGGIVPLEDIESRLGMTTPTKVKASKTVKPNAAKSGSRQKVKGSK